MKIAVRRRLAAAAVLSMTATVGAVVLTTGSSSADFSVASVSPPTAGNYPSYPQPVGVTFTLPTSATSPPIPVGANVHWTLVGTSGDNEISFDSNVDSTTPAPPTGQKPHTTVDFSNVNDPTTTGFLAEGPADPGAYLVEFQSPNGATLQRCAPRPGCFPGVWGGPPTVTPAAPNQIPAGTTTAKVTFTGTNFARNTSFQVLPVSGNSATDVAIIRDDTSNSPGPPSDDGTTFNALVTVPAAATLGVRDVQVTNKDGQTSICSRCFTVLGATLTGVNPASSTNNDTDNAR